MRAEDFTIPPCQAGAILFAPDVEKLASFYVDALGFTESMREDGHVLLRRAGFELLVHAVPRTLADRIGRASANRRIDTAIKLVFAVTDLSEARARVIGCDGELDPPEREWSWQGVRIVDGGDPEGNVFQLRQHARHQKEQQVSTHQLDYIAPVLRVADLGRALAHYRERLGFAVEFVHGDFYACVERDGCRIHLKQVPAEARNPGARLADGHIDVCFSVRDAGSLAASFVKSGVDFTVPLREMPYGKEFYLRDMDGYVLAFVESAPEN